MQVFDAETIAHSGIFSELAEENPELEAVFLQVEAALESGQAAFIAMELGVPAMDGHACVSRYPAIPPPYVA